MSREVLYTVDGPAAHAQINREKQMNALSNEVLAQLREAITEAREDDSVRVLILSGAGERAFCAGGDLRQMGEADAARDHESRGALAELFQDLWKLGKPTIARIQGHALAGGMGLALSCDFVVASENAQFGVPEVSVGLWPYMITLPLLRSMPPKTALQLMLTGRRVDAFEGERIGFVSHLTKPEELDKTVTSLVEQLSLAAPIATRLGRTSFYAALDSNDAVRLAMLQNALTVNLGTKEAREGLEAFAQKRRPAWQEQVSNDHRKASSE